MVLEGVRGRFIVPSWSAVLLHEVSMHLLRVSREDGSEHTQSQPLFEEQDVPFQLPTQLLHWDLG